MYTLKNVCILIVLALTASSCQREHVHTTTPAFYYWKTVFAPVPSDQKAMQDLHTKRLYIRFFDVDWNTATSQPQPLATVHLSHQMPQGYEYIPVIFITQQAITSVKPANIPALAGNITKLLSTLTTSGNIPLKEIQVDCDWTTSSREVYFALLQQLKNDPFLHDKLLTCTIRLHQVKYKRNSGIPPVDRGMLMCYNVGDLKQPAAQNSILDVPLVKNYLEHLDTYPLRLDVALPLFRWCVLFRKGVFAGIIRDADPDELTTPLFQKSRHALYTITTDTLWHGYRLHAGDVIRPESPSVKDLKEVADFTAHHLHNDSLTVAFFHTDSLTLSHYTTDELKEILDTYH